MQRGADNALSDEHKYQLSSGEVLETEQPSFHTPPA
jgi:hypothetical protein